jgi:hypothetical protein
MINHTYKPVSRVTIEIPSIHRFAVAKSTEEAPVEVRRTERGAVLQFPLDWTDVILLPRQ